MRSRNIFMIVLLCLSTGAAHAELGVGIHASTLGLGADCVLELQHQLNIRGTANTLSRSFDGEESGNDYTFDLSLFSVGGMVDYHIFDGGFRLSGGVLLNSNAADMEAEVTVTEDYEIGGQTYSASEVGLFTGEMEFSSLAPYAGIGWGNAVGVTKSLGLMLDLGVAFQGSPTIALGTSTQLPNAQAQQELEENLRAEEADLEDEISEFTLYPVVSLGLTYRF